MSASRGKGGDYAREIAVDAPCERAFDAVATVEGLRGWWTPLATGDAAHVRLRFAGLDELIDMRLVYARRPRQAAWQVVEHSSLGRVGRDHAQIRSLGPR